MENKTHPSPPEQIRAAANNLKAQLLEIARLSGEPVNENLTLPDILQLLQYNIWRRFYAKKEDLKQILYDGHYLTQEQIDFLSNFPEFGQITQKFPYEPIIKTNNGRCIYGHYIPGNNQISIYTILGYPEMDGIEILLLSNSERTLTVIRFSNDVPQYESYPPMEKSSLIESIRLHILQAKYYYTLGCNNLDEDTSWWKILLYLETFYTKNFERAWKPYLQDLTNIYSKEESAYIDTLPAIKTICQQASCLDVGTQDIDGNPVKIVLLKSDVPILLCKIETEKYLFRRLDLYFYIDGRHVVVNYVPSSQKTDDIPQEVDATYGNDDLPF